MSEIVATESASTPLFLLHLLTTGAAVALLEFARRHQTSTAGRWFVRWLVAVSAWIGFHTLGLIVVDPGVRNLTDSVELAAIPASAACWLLFTFSYSGRWSGDDERVPAAVLLPTAVVVGVVLTNPLHGAVHRVSAVEVSAGVATVADGTTTELIWPLLAYVFGFYCCGFVLLEELVRSTNRLYRDQIVALFVGVAIPLVAAALTMLGLSPLPVDATPLSFTLSALPLSYAVFRSEVHRLVPATHRVGEQTVLEAVEHGVVVLDDDERVVFANESAASAFDRPREWLLGQQIDGVLDASELEPEVGWLESEQADAGAADDRRSRSDGGPGERAAERDAADGDEDGSAGGERTDASCAGSTAVPRTLRDETTGRTYRVTASQSEDEAGYKTLVVEEVTEERRRRQRLLVLNRIVRHNLRNDLTALRGHAELLGERVDDDAVAVVEDIAADLTRLGEKAHEMDQVMREADSGTEVVNVANVVDRVASEVEARTAATVEVWGDVQAWTRTQPELVETIVSNLVELSVRRHDERLELEDGRRGDERTGDDRSRSGTAAGREGAQAEDRRERGPEEDRPGGVRADGQSARGGADPPRPRTDPPAGQEGRSWPTRGIPDAPTIVVTVSAEPDAVRLTVEDDGPGIPEREVQGLLDDQGAPLPHGASIGLWVVKWCVDIADADWEIETDGWTRVTVTFPSEPDLQGTATGIA